MKRLLAMLCVAAAILSISAAAFADGQESGYENTLFDQSKPIEIDILMDDETWDYMIANASDEEFVACDMMVNGVLYKNVGIRPKGNSSMSSVSSQGSERFSWRIKFDKYEKKRTCDGLDVLILNNGFKDPGELREAIAYDMYAFLEADASLYNYAVVRHNGEYTGVYLALEGVDKSFARRNYGKNYGELYKPEIIGKAGNRNPDNAKDAPGGFNMDGNGFPAAFGDGQNGGFLAFPDQNAPADGAGRGGFGGQRPAGGGMPGGFQMPGMDGDRARSDSELAMALNYVGDDLENYQGIWESAKFKSDEVDFKRVVEALKHICRGDNIEEYLDVDNVMKYLAIQTFVYNHDGLTGTVSHNYYLYEQDGKLNLIPWDLNEAFTLSGDGSGFVNFPIDTPFTINDLSQRSFFMALLEDEACLAKYHEYLRRLSEEYALGGGLAATYERIRGQIDPLVASDPSAFSSYDQYVSAAQSLKRAVELRAQGVLGQLSGEIPSTREGQNAEPDKMLDVSGENLSGLTGGFGMGMAGFNMPGVKGGKGNL